ncbi:hypothetical protein Aph01nite_05880 [Acrocarpospora phusangensis]|uniref:DUF1877 domain-containing protein n=1 Tax=Acrocarpospora phusangensis TaxID=1070424 RepID=A0A919ULG5_9ACTN|nr:hypothetical protein [Acrocarpospora phusangensis]GIH22278.1 hypothetical protein Aph01nite_05880 [Acrocarpospora phusangensis]
MGVLYDYYRAAGRDAAIADPENPRAVDEPERPVFDAVDAKSIDPHVAFGQLVALAAGVPYSIDLIDSVMLYPPPEGAPQSDEEWESLPEDSPYLDGSWIAELPVMARDALADLDDSRVPEVAGRWSEAEEFKSWSPEDRRHLFALTEQFVGLARRAKADDQLLYCWSCT